MPRPGRGIAAISQADMVDYLLDIVAPSSRLARDGTGRTAADAACDAGYPILAAQLRDAERAARRELGWS